MYMVLLIVDDPAKCSAVLEAWSEAGAPGATVLPSTGYERVKRLAGLSGDLPLMPSLSDFLETEEDRHNTLFTIVRGHEVVERVVAVTQGILGDLNEPNTGILVVLPVLEAYGLDRRG